MYQPGQHHSAMAPPPSRSVAPETFLLDQDAQQSLPPDAVVALQQVDNLKYFLISAPVDWQPDQYIRRFLLPTGEYVSCVLWNNLFHISGTDIVRCLSFRFHAFGRPVKNSKKFEEGIFSDLRNLKSGTDASLEEPKSAFLDFLYKNNCIRTQKKQKVFYWYSVPHDRLFLDALERDLKREKMGQEATTLAVNEPALSFEFDSSQSLFEQLTKAQQTNSSSFNTNMPAYSQTASPAVHPMDSMPPPSMVPQSQPLPPQSVPEENIGQMAQYQHPAGMGHQMGPVQKARERDFSAPIQYDRNGIPLNQVNNRHSSVPAYMEYSPAPSFVSSHYEDYSNRGMSFEPLTPPQQHMSVAAEPAYIANEDTGLYTAIPELGMSGGVNSMMQLPPSNLVAPHFPGMGRNFGAPANVYSVIEGSPTYKQRRRRSSLSAGVAAAVTATGGAALTHAVHRPSDLRRSLSSSVVAVQEIEETKNSETSEPVPGEYLTQPQAQQPQQHEVVDISRHGTPFATIENSPPDQSLQVPPQQHLQPEIESAGQPNGEVSDQVQALQRPQPRTVNPGVFRRARSATTMELGPYPHKSHSCPIPTCGRLFKRLEHLKRHVRTHTQERPYVCSSCNKAFSRSDNLAQHRRIHDAQKDGETLPPNFEEEIDNSDNHFGSLKEEEHAEMEQRLQPPQAYMTSSLAAAAPPPMPDMSVMAGFGAPRLSMAPPPQMMVAENY